MIIEKQIDELTKERFSFWVNGNILILDSYNLFLRENKTKRKYNSIKCYDRLYTRNSTITLEQVPLTEEIKNEALQEYIKTLKVMTWEEYKSK
jgi:hypothetical protein